MKKKLNSKNSKRKETQKWKSGKVKKKTCKLIVDYCENERANCCAKWKPFSTQHEEMVKEAKNKNKNTKSNAENHTEPQVGREVSATVTKEINK